MNFYTIQIISGVTQLLILGIWVWIAIILFRQRTRAAWLVLIGTILTVGHAFFKNFGSSLLRGLVGLGSNNYYLSMTMLGIVASLLTVWGLLMHVLQQRSESERIAELEAIIRDRDGMP